MPDHNLFYLHVSAKWPGKVVNGDVLNVKVLEAGEGGGGGGGGPINM